MNDILRQSVLVGVILIILAVIELGIEVFAAPMTADEMFSSDWNHYNYGVPTLSFESPKELRRIRPDIPGDLLKYLRYAETYSFKEIDCYYLTIHQLLFH